MHVEIVGHQATEDVPRLTPTTTSGAGLRQAARSRGLGLGLGRCGTLFIVLFASAIVITAGGFGVYFVESHIDQVEASAQALRDRVDALAGANEELQRALAAAKRGESADVKSAEAAAKQLVSSRVAESEARSAKAASTAVDKLRGELASDVSGLKKDVADVRTQVKALDSSVSSIRKKLAETPKPYAAPLDDWRAVMQQQQQQQQQQPNQPQPDRQQREDQFWRQQQEGNSNFVHTPFPNAGLPPPPEGGSLGTGKRRSPNAPAIQRPFADIEDPVERNAKRLGMIRDEFAQTWRAYRKHAWGRDELKPVSRTYRDWVKTSKGVALTAFDSLTTLALMNLTQELDAAIELVLHEVDLDQSMRISAFESTIRMVAGLLSVFELTGEKDRRLVSRAAQVMDKLLWAYNTSSGVPHQTVNLRTHRHWCPDWTAGGGVLSEFGSVQLELRTLSYHTGNPLYDMRATHLMDIAENRCEPDMLCPTFIDIDSGLFRDDHITLGALGDSFYEYLVKQYLLTGKTEQRYRDDAIAALDGVIRRLLRYSTPSRQAYLAEFQEGSLQHRMDELTCFAGGMFALASMEIPDSGHKKEFGKVAEELTRTCYKMFAEQDTGLAPESVEFPGGADFINGQLGYLLRPETVESLFYVWRLTKNETYRDWAWDIFSAMHQYCRVRTGGYTGIVNVEMIPPEADDVQQSFFLAETMKYLFLIFSDDSVLPLDQWVLNTEAHPLKIRKRDPMDVWTEWEARHGGALPWEAPTLTRMSKVTLTPTQRKKRALRPDYQVIAPVDPLAMEEPDPDEEANAIEQQKALIDMAVNDAKLRSVNEERRAVGLPPIDDAELKRMKENVDAATTTPNAPPQTPEPTTPAPPVEEDTTTAAPTAGGDSSAGLGGSAGSGSGSDTGGAATPPPATDDAAAAEA